MDWRRGETDTWLRESSRHDESHHDGDNCDDDPDDGDGGVGHPVPEPSTVLLVGAGLLGLGRRLRSRP